jgi:3-dehydro-4-phosphotetronate decarboxylase
MTVSIVSEETKMRDAICRVGKSLFDRRLTFGSTGNISVRLSDGRTILTPTNESLAELDPARLSVLGADGAHIDGGAPTKEAFLHTCIYSCRSTAVAVVHLHSTHAVAVSILGDVDANDVLPPLTAYYVMRVGQLPLVPYFAPGDSALADAVKAKAVDHHAVLLANHGPVVAGVTLSDAQYATEELEETAHLYLTLRQERIRALTPMQVADLRRQMAARR